MDHEEIDESLLDQVDQDQEDQEENVENEEDKEKEDMVDEEDGTDDQKRLGRLERSLNSDRRFNNRYQLESDKRGPRLR